MQRRDFLQQCQAAGIAGTGLVSMEALVAASAHAQPKAYARVKLVGEDNKPLKLKQLAARKNYVFHYPFESTPAFLLNLGKPSAQQVAMQTAKGSAYTWAGGVGPNKAVVAFVAICSHQMAYPTKDISFISFRDEARGASKRAQVIHCCAEHSQYDPAQGAKVVAGPAPQPLAAILLEHDAATDELFATGVQGGEIFDQFFAKYQIKLQMDHGSSAQRLAAQSVVVKPLENFCRQQMQC
jgi:arsenite oxidase small subunit